MGDTYDFIEREREDSERIKKIKRENAREVKRKEQRGKTTRSKDKSSH